MRGCLRPQIRTADMFNFFQIIPLKDAIFEIFIEILFTATNIKPPEGTPEMLSRNNFTPARARNRPDFTSREQRVEASQL
jgi:hypothetical protein